VAECGCARSYLMAAPLRVAVTRAAGRTDTLAARLTAAGVQVHEVPLTRVVRCDPAPLHAALQALGDTRWILLTSVNAVDVLADAVAVTGTTDAVQDCWFAVVGEVTARAAAAHGWHADVVPSQYRAEELLDALASRSDVRGQGVLYPCAAGARDVLPEGLRTLGARVQVIATYESVPDLDGQRLLAHLLAAGDLDLVTVAAPSAVDALAEAVPPERAAQVALASIGPVTSKAARQAGFRVVLEANPYTVDALARGIVDWRGGGR
jgi:uroporphyrinogen-III synthase